MSSQKHLYKVVNIAFQKQAVNIHATNRRPMKVRREKRRRRRRSIRPREEEEAGGGGVH